jgi:hypothetical protein
LRLVPGFDDDMESTARLILFGSPFDLSISPPKPEPSEAAAGSQCKAPEASGTASRAEPLPCECPGAGFCQRHGFQKDAHNHMLCKSRSDYRALWDRLARGEAATPSTQRCSGGS